MKISNFGFLGMCVFLIANIPSLKLFFPSNFATNVVFLLLAVLASVYNIHSHERILIQKQYSILLIGFSTIVLLMIVPLIVTSSRGIFTYSFGAIYTLFICGLVYISARSQDLSTYVYFQFMWGIIICLLYISNIVDYSRDLGQHYNTIVLPITLGLIISLNYLLKKGGKARIAILFSSVILILGLLSLGGRGPFIGIPALFILLAGIQICKSRKISYKNIISAVLSLITVVGLAMTTLRVTEYEASNLLIHRIERTIEDPTSESRFELYSESINLIINNPWGYGIGTYYTNSGFPYPHNIILHIAYAGGWLAGLLGLFIFILVFIELVKKASYSNFIISSISLICIYLMYIFSVSYSIHNSYMLFVPIFILFSQYNEYRVSVYNCLD